nr:hypothetical protein L204_06368 [Cryptococcus depauperatus CBS 7855]
MDIDGRSVDERSVDEHMEDIVDWRDPETQYQDGDQVMEEDNNSAIVYEEVVMDAPTPKAELPELTISTSAISSFGVPSVLKAIHSSPHTPELEMRAATPAKDAVISPPNEISETKPAQELVAHLSPKHNVSADTVHETIAMTETSAEIVQGDEDVNTSASKPPFTAATGDSQQKTEELVPSGLDPESHADKTDETGDVVADQHAEAVSSARSQEPDVVAADLQSDNSASKKVLEEDDEYGDEDYYDDEPLTAETLPVIILHLPQDCSSPSSPARALFVPVDNDQESLVVWLKDRQMDLAEANLADVWGAIRAECAREGLVQCASDELVIFEKLMNLKMSEDDVNLQSITFLELLQLHRGCDLPEPVQLYLTWEPSRFVTRFNAIQSELQIIKEKSASADGQGESIGEYQDESIQMLEGEEAYDEDEGFDDDQYGYQEDDRDQGQVDQLILPSKLETTDPDTNDGDIENNDEHRSDAIGTSKPAQDHSQDATPQSSRSLHEQSVHGDHSQEENVDNDNNNAEDAKYDEEPKDGENEERYVTKDNTDDKVELTSEELSDSGQIEEQAFVGVDNGISNKSDLQDEIVEEDDTDTITKDGDDVDEFAIPLPGTETPAQIVSTQESVSEKNILDTGTHESEVVQTSTRAEHISKPEPLVNTEHDEGVKDINAESTLADDDAQRNSADGEGQDEEEYVDREYNVSAGDAESVLSNEKEDEDETYPNEEGYESNQDTLDEDEGLEEDPEALDQAEPTIEDNGAQVGLEGPSTTSKRLHDDDKREDAGETKRKRL